MEEAIHIISNEILKNIRTLRSLQDDCSGDVDRNDDNLLKCKTYIEGLRNIRTDIETLLLET